MEPHPGVRTSSALCAPSPAAGEGKLNDGLRPPSPCRRRRVRDEDLKRGARKRQRPGGCQGCFSRSVKNALIRSGLPLEIASNLSHFKSSHEMDRLSTNIEPEETLRFLTKDPLARKLSSPAGCQPYISQLRMLRSVSLAALLPRIISFVSCFRS
jgi:hypothetical protein